jgi:hypothetical protein
MASRVAVRVAVRVATDTRRIVLQAAATDPATALQIVRAAGYLPTDTPVRADGEEWVVIVSNWYHPPTLSSAGGK